MLHAYTFLVYNKRMLEKYYFEFSKVYCRIMRLEMLIKKRLVSSLLPYYSDDIISKFEKFFYNKERLSRYNNKTGNAFMAILKNPQIKKESQKFIRLVNIMYLSDLLFIFLCCEQFRKEEITKAFYHKIPEKFGKLIKSRQTLLDLRNAIAHYNFRDYEQNRKDYLEVLELFEISIGSNIRGIDEIPKLGYKPSVNIILQAIKDLRPDLIEIDPNKDDEMEYFYNKHRVLIDLCDEIALHNGYEPKDLPSPWTVLRQMYAIKNKTVKPTIKIEDLPLFKCAKCLEKH